MSEVNMGSEYEGMSEYKWIWVNMTSNISEYEWIEVNENVSIWVIIVNMSEHVWWWVNMIDHEWIWMQMYVICQWI